MPSGPRIDRTVEPKLGGAVLAASEKPQTGGRRLGEEKEGKLEKRRSKEGGRQKGRIMKGVQAQGGPSRVKHRKNKAPNDAQGPELSSFHHSRCYLQSAYFAPFNRLQSRCFFNF